MKKIFVILLCAMILCTMPIVAFAEGESVNEEITVTEGEVVDAEPSETVTEMIVDWLQDNSIDISIVATILLSIFYERIKHRKLSGSIGTLNNNAITVAENSASAIQAALTKVEALSDVVKNYEQKMVVLIEEIQNSEEEKKALKDALVKVESYLNTAKLANIEFANELAELLCLSNIPNAKKDELYKTHIEGIRKLEAAEEVIANDGKEA
ncbi:MAG: hypothetical protein U0M06_14105 [Clostridia bacterium]|nr:hypothetical protein [Clostridia bacterium]